MRNYLTKKQKDFENAVDEMDIVYYIVFDKNKDFYNCDTLTKAQELATKINGTIYFYHYTQVADIIANIDDKLWDIISLADDETYDFDSHIRRNAKKRLVYNLTKIGLTLTDWELWCTL